MTGPWAYFDTSVLIKRYVREPGSARAQALLRQYRFLSSAVAPVEVMSALHRRRSVGDLAEVSFTAIVSRLARDRAYWELVEVTSAVLNRAELVIRQTGVRTLDAIHLASAVYVRSSAGPRAVRLPFITADDVQREAADRLGLEVHWVV